MRSFFKDISIYGFGNIFNRSVNLLLLPLFTAYLTPIDYGIQSMLSFMLLLLGPIANLGIGTSFAICYNDQSTSKAKEATIWSSLLLLLSVSGVLSLLSFWNASSLSTMLFSDSRYGILVSMTAITFLFNASMMPFNAYLQFERKATLFVLISSSSALFNILINCYLVMRLGWGIEGLVWGALLANIFQFTLSGLVTWKNTQFVWSSSIARALIKHGLPMIPSFFFLFILQNSWRFILERLQTIAELGIFSVGYNIGSVSTLFVGSLVSSWAPYFFPYADKQEEAKEHFKKIYTYYYLAAGTLAVLFFAYSKFVVTLFTAQPFHGCWSIVGWIALGNLITAGYYLCLPGVYYAKRVYLSNISLAVGSVMMISMTYVLTISFGTIGTAMGFFIGQFSMAATQQVVNHTFKLFTVPHESLRLAKYSIAFAFIVACTYLPRNFSLAAEFCFATALLPIYSFLAWKTFHNDEKMKLKLLCKSILNNFLRKRSVTG